MPETPEILLKAADVIEKRGWHQGDFVPTNSDTATCRVCVSAALNVAVGLPPNGYIARGNDTQMAAAAIRARRLLGRFLGAPVVEWNDEIAERPEQVITALRECAADLSGGAS